MISVGIASVGLVGPGLDNWDAAKGLIRSGEAYDPGQTVSLGASALLPPNERRRTTALIQMVLQCCDDTLRLSGPDHSLDLPGVFACSCGDLDVVDRILVALTQPDKPVSPTLFHNSVHNAPAGYLSIATSNRAPSTSISAHDGSFVAGLLEAVSQVRESNNRVLLVAYDGATPTNLQPFRPRTSSFAVGLLLTPEQATGVARLDVDLAEEGPIDRMAQAGFETLRAGNPAARSLPLLERIATGSDAEVHIPYLDGRRARIRVIAGESR